MKRGVKVKNVLGQLVAGSLFYAIAAVPIQFGDDGTSKVHSRNRDLIVAVTSKATQAAFEAEFSTTSTGAERLALEDVCAKFGPRASSVSAVQEWAAAHGASMVSATR